MKILITGGAGFIGSNLAGHFLREGHHVIALDNLQTGSWQNLDGLGDHPCLERIEHDVCEPFFFDVERIYHLACPASPPAYQLDPIKTMLVNVLGTLHALELAEKTGARVLQASTSEVYGDPKVSHQPETYRGWVNPTGPRACYDEGKRAAEALCFDFHRLGRAQIRVARLFNTYGPRMSADDGRVVTNFLSQALGAEAFTVYGDGKQTRSFCFVDDTIRGLCLLMESDEVGPINIGNDREITVLALVEEIRALLDSDMEIKFVPLPTDDPLQRRPDLSKARELLGYEPTVALRDGLLKTIAYLQATRPAQA